MITRREIFSLLAAGTVAASGLLLPERSIFLPPHGGWITSRLRMDIPIHNAHIWQRELDNGFVSFSADVRGDCYSGGDRLRIWTGTPVDESQPLKDWRQFVSDWWKTRSDVNHDLVKREPEKSPDMGILRANRFSSENLTAVNDSLSAIAASQRAREIRAKQETAAFEWTVQNRDRIMDRILSA